MKRLPVLLCTTLALCLTPKTSEAWGREGHQLIADLAMSQLTPATRARVQAILDTEPGATLPGISTWADETRTPSTAGWHYVNFERGSDCSYVANRECPEGKCVVAAIEKQLDVLQNSTDPEEKLKALKWTVHLVADVHQPLHAGFADDKGANLYQVQAWGKGGNLHSVWDTGFLANWAGGSAALREAVEASKPDAASLTRKSPGLWAQESCRIASDADFYPDGRFITPDYVKRWSPVIAGRLAASARRLAQSLERALRP